MCLIVFALDCHPRYRLVLAANRDEYFNRPTAPAAFWADAPQVLAGRDLLAGGTWLGVTRERRLAAVTYYREPSLPVHQLPSRGRLAADFLAGTMTPEAYLERIRREGGRYGGFNLLFGDDSGLFYHTSPTGTVTPTRSSPTPASASSGNGTSPPYSSPAATTAPAPRP